MINIPTTDLIEQVEYCGTKSGQDVDKFRETKLTPKLAEYVKAPLIDECPVNFECQVVNKMRLGDATMFAGKVLAIHVKEGVFDGERLDLKKAPTIGYTYVAYRGVGKVLKER